MKLTKSSREPDMGPADGYTGTVFIDPVRNSDEQSAIGCTHIGCAHVRVEVTS